MIFISIYNDIHRICLQIIFLPPGSLSGGTVLVKQLFKLVWPKGARALKKKVRQEVGVVTCVNQLLMGAKRVGIKYLDKRNYCVGTEPVHWYI